MHKEQYLLLVLRPSSRVFHILMVDGKHGLNEILFRVNGVEKLLFLRGTPKFHLLMGEINQQYKTELVHY